jgi:hypothetical protein
MLKLLPGMTLPVEYHCDILFTGLYCASCPSFAYKYVLAYVPPAFGFSIGGFIRGNAP